MADSYTFTSENSISLFVSLKETKIDSGKLRTFASFSITIRPTKKMWYVGITNVFGIAIWKMAFRKDDYEWLTIDDIVLRLDRSLYDRTEEFEITSVTAPNFVIRPSLTDVITKITIGDSFDPAEYNVYLDSYSNRGECHSVYEAIIK